MMKIDLPYEIRQEIQKVVDSAEQIAWVQPPSDLVTKIKQRIERYRSVEGKWLGHQDICLLQNKRTSLN